LEPQFLASIIQAAIDTVYPAINAKNIQLETIFDAENILIDGDADRLQQIFWNLLSNAVKFTADGGKIKVAMKLDNSFAEIIIADNGNGIEPDFLPYVFDRFRQADGKSNRKYGGLGLGLAVVKQLTELHGGSIRAESKGLHQGATFTIRIPLKKVTPEVTDANNPVLNNDAENISTESEISAKLLRNLTILAVDDEADALELVAFVLTENGAKVLTANTVDKALAIYDSEPVDFIISDIGLPDKDGFELIREMKTRFEQLNQSIPMIALTAYASKIDKTRIIQAGYRAFLSKPFEVSELIELIIKSGNSESENKT
jgi:CheY-like chemotaxis protein